MEMISGGRDSRRQATPASTGYQFSTRGRWTVSQSGFPAQYKPKTSPFRESKPAVFNPSDFPRNPSIIHTGTRRVAKTVPSPFQALNRQKSPETSPDTSPTRDPPYRGGGGHNDPYAIGLEVHAETRTVNVYRWTCPFCKASLTHLFRQSLEWNMKCHLEGHEKRVRPEPLTIRKVERQIQIREILKGLERLKRKLGS